MTLQNIYHELTIYLFAYPPNQAAEAERIRNRNAILHKVTAAAVDTAKAALGAARAVASLALPLEVRRIYMCNLFYLSSSDCCLFGSQSDSL